MTAAYVPDAVCEAMEYRNPAGESVLMIMRAGALGRMMPPIATTTLPVPSRNGSRWLGAAHLERIVEVPTVFPGTISDRAELRRWAHVLDPTLGEGTLTVVQGPSAGRYIRCTYDAGMEALSEERPDLNLGSLLFRAAWPYWLESSESSIVVQQGSSVTKWFPFLPLILGASDAFSAFTVTISGDVPSWPVISVLGPGQEVTARNLTTGKFWTVIGALAAGATLTVDTRPGFKAVTIDGVNAFNRLAAGSSLWPLVPGPNRVEVSMALTSSASRASFAWRNQWLAA